MIRFRIQYDAPACRTDFATVSPSAAQYLGVHSISLNAVARTRTTAIAMSRAKPWTKVRNGREVRIRSITSGSDTTPQASRCRQDVRVSIPAFQADRPGSSPGAGSWMSNLTKDPRNTCGRCARVRHKSVQRRWNSNGNRSAPRSGAIPKSLWKSTNAPSAVRQAPTGPSARAKTTARLTGRTLDFGSG